MTPAGSATGSWPRSRPAPTRATSAGSRTQQPRRAAAGDEPYVRPRQGPVRRGRPDVRRRVPSGRGARRAQGGRRRRVPTPPSTRGVSWLTAPAVRERPVDQLPERHLGRRARPPTPTTFAGPGHQQHRHGGAGPGGVRPAPARGGRPRNRCRPIQSADGGFPFLAAPGQTSDPDSTALSIQGILALGGSPTTARWRVSGVGPYAALAAYQLGCADPAADRGAYFFPGDRSPNVLATVQAVVAASRARPSRCRGRR